MANEKDWCPICKMGVNDIVRHNSIVHPPPPPPEELVPWSERDDR